ncbi:MAG: carbamate kinase [Planctomycetota bacterium]|nr:carbamate kinase [Planctomycetota bacterium]
MPTRYRKKLLLVALGGNALLKRGQQGTISEQEHTAAETCGHLMCLVRQGFNLVITHGNGPQVGNILLKNEAAANMLPVMPLDVCVADSQGSIGYIIQQAMLNHLRAAGIRRYVVTMITQVVVDKNDPAFKKPTKPVGPFFDQRRATELMLEKKWAMIEDSDRGFRRVVPSPKPLKVIQRYMIRDLAQAGHIVIAVGGGGIPIWKKENSEYEGIEAVVDKDAASAVLAREMETDHFIILTEVPCVFLNYGKPDQTPVRQMTLTEARKYSEEKQFGVGSMAPKIEAAIDFVAASSREALITSAESLASAMENKEGTRIVPDAVQARKTELF